MINHRRPSLARTVSQFAAARQHAANIAVAAAEIPVVANLAADDLVNADARYVIEQLAYAHAAVERALSHLCARTGVDVVPYPA